MNETKKEEDEVSMKSSRIFSRMVSKVGYINQKRCLENLRSRVEQRKIKGYIFNWYDVGQASSYANTIKDISQYRGTKCKNERHVRYLVENFKAPILNTPRFLSDTASLSKK